MTGVSATTLATLCAAATSASRAAAGAQLCAAVAALDGLRSSLAGLGLAPASAARLASDALDAEVPMLSLAATTDCGGVAAGAEPAQARLRVLSTSPSQITVRAVLPAARFTGEVGGATAYVQMFQNGLTGLPDAIGGPLLPAIGALYGLPARSRASVRVLAVSGYRLPGVLLYPNQPDSPAQSSASPTSQADPALPFTVNADAYRSTDARPASPASRLPGGRMRDLRLGGVLVTGSQYTPATEDLRVLTSVTVRITLAGGNRRSVFGPARVRLPSDQPFGALYRQLLLNWSTVAGHLKGGATPGAGTTPGGGTTPGAPGTPSRRSAASR